VDIGRHAARIADLDDRLSKSEANGRELEHRLSETLETLAERTDLLGSTEMALHEVTEGAERMVASMRLLRSYSEELGREKEVVLTRVAAHEAIIGDMHQRNTDLQHELAQLRDDFAKLKIDAERLGGVDGVLGAVVGGLEAAKAANETLEQTLKAGRGRGAPQGSRASARRGRPRRGGGGAARRARSRGAAAGNRRPRRALDRSA